MIRKPLGQKRLIFLLSEKNLLSRIIGVDGPTSLYRETSLEHQDPSLPRFNETSKKQRMPAIIR